MSNPDPKDPKLEWMYKGTKDLLNREDYLLGRTVDKNFEILDAEEKKEKESQLFGVSVPKNHVEYECIPFSIREYRSLQSTEQVDIQRKILEDPLMAIKQKEIESRRKLLENPVKLKQLHNILKMEKLKTSSKNKKRKKSKKKKKSSHSSSDSDNDSSGSDSDKDLDKALAKKFKKVKGSLDEDEMNSDKDFDKILNNKFKKLNKELDAMTKSKHKKSKKSKKRKKSTSNSSSTSSSSDNDAKMKKLSNHSKNIEPRDVRRNFITRHLNLNSRKKPDSKALNSTYESRRTNSKSGQKVKNNRLDTSRRCSRSPKRETRRSGSRSSDYRRKRSRSRSRQAVTGKHSSRRNIHRSDSRSKEDRKYNDSRSRSRSKEKSSSRDRQNSKKKSHKVEKRQRSRSPSRQKDKSPGKDDSKNSSAIDKPSKYKLTGKLTEEEKEMIRQKMMQHGNERNEERATKVQEYRKNVEIEENKQKSDFDHNFANKEMQKAYTASTSVESRIKSNLNNIQRTSRAMDSNFARK